MDIEGVHGWGKQDPRKYKVVVQPGRRHTDGDHPKGKTQQACFRPPETKSMDKKSVKVQSDK